MIVYGMTNCVKTIRALEWLQTNQIDFIFHDIRKIGVSKDKIEEWDKLAGFDRFLNTSIRTWSTLYPKEKIMANERAFALSLMCRRQNLIKRPVLEDLNFLYFGFNKDYYEEFLTKTNDIY